MTPSLCLSATHNARGYTLGASRSNRFPGPWGRVPDLDLSLSLVAAGRGQAFAVRAEGYAPDLPPVTDQRELACGRRVPDLHRLESVGGGQAPAIGTQRDAAEAALVREGADHLPGDRVPELDGFVGAGRREAAV